MATIGTRLYTLLCGALVGEDDAGNRYYRERWGRSGPGQRERRWVVYEGEVEASRVPPEWHRWLHHSTDEPRPRHRSGRSPGRSRTSPISPARPPPTGRRATSWAAGSATARPGTTSPGSPTRVGQRLRETRRRPVS